MIKLKNIFHRLDLQLSLIVGVVVVLWFISFLVTARMMNKERFEKNSYLERERIGLRVNAEQTRILNDLLLEHRRSLELTVEDLYHSLSLVWVELSVRGKTIVKFGNRNIRSDHFILEQTYPIVFDGKEFAKLGIGKELWIMNDSEVVPKKWMFGIAISMITIFFLIRLFIQKQIVNPLNLLIQHFSSNNSKESIPNYRSHSSEMDGLIQSFQKMHQELMDAQMRMSDHEKQAVLGSLAAQVAHDIRSPLTALSVVNEDLSELPESKRVLVRSAVSRIRDIANSLLEKKNAIRPIHAANVEEAVSPQLLVSLLENIVSEKRIQYRARFNVEIKADLAQVGYGLFVQVQPKRFKNVLSNLINNAVEAIDGEGKVNLSVESRNGAVTIIISDTGRGISFERQKLLFQQGATFDKAGGSGLGLYHAKLDVEKWGGRVSIDSNPGNGTKVTLFLPDAQKPRWFVEKLRLRTDAVIGILDDDASIHLTWKKRLEESAGKTNKLVHFSTPEELSAWLKNPNNLASLFLVDYEFRGQSASGLDVVETLSLQDKAILVTSHSDETEVLSRCEALGVPLLPKSMADIVPIEFSNAAAV